jgi:hypothetical protein
LITTGAGAFAPKLPSAFWRKARLCDAKLAIVFGPWL